MFNCKTWLVENSIEHRMYNQVLKKTTKKKPKYSNFAMVRGSLFLMNRNDVDEAIKKWPNSIESLEEPFNDNQIDFLRENVRTLVRPRLVYGKYKHVVKFRRVWNERLHDVDDWIKANLDVSDENLKWRKQRWNSTLYLSSDSDLFLVKMTWQDKILEIITILKVTDL